VKTPKPITQVVHYKGKGSNHTSKGEFGHEKLSRNTTWGGEGKKKGGRKSGLNCFKKNSTDFWGLNGNNMKGKGKGGEMKQRQQISTRASPWGTTDLEKSPRSVGNAMAALMEEYRIRATNMPFVKELKEKERNKNEANQDA